MCFVSAVLGSVFAVPVKILNSNLSKQDSDCNLVWLCFSVLVCVLSNVHLLCYCLSVSCYNEWLTNTNQDLNHFHRWPDVYLGLTTMGQNMSVPNLQRALSHALASLPSGKTSSSASSCNQPVITGELMVHPGYPSHPQVGGCGEGPDDFSQSADRQHELSMLRDPSLLALYSQKSVQLCAFKDLWLSTEV